MKKLILAIVVVFSAGSLMAQSKIGHVNSQKILDTIPSRKVAINKLKEHESQGIKELEELQMDYETAYKAYAAKVQSGGLSPVLREAEERKLMTKEQNISNFQQTFQMELQAYSQELNEPILEMVQSAVKVVAEKHKLSYVIDETVTLYFGGGTDITAEVIAEVLKLDKGL